MASPADPKLQALLELERRGKLGPEAGKLLAAYRSQGVSKTTPLGPQGQASPSNADLLETKSKRDEARKAMDLIGRVQPQLDRVRTLYDQNLKGSGPLQSLKEYLPSQRNSQFDNAVAMLRTLVRPATRTPGEGSMSDFESKLALQALPDRWSFDGSNEESLTGLQTFLESAKADYSKRLGLPQAPPKRSSAPKAIRLDENGRIIP